jgi:hypothetical protein
MFTLSTPDLQTYRAQTFRTEPGSRLTTPEQAVQFIDERGFTFFWPIKEVLLPSLWTAVAGDRPVADAHEDPGHISWGWKDALLGKHRWYYGRVLRKRNTIISNEAAPYFYALTENYGSPDEDYLLQYEQGRMTMEARQIFETLLAKGPMHTVELRKSVHMTNRESNGRFNKALDDLQKDFKIMPTGVAEAGAWNYAFIYDIVSRYEPELVENARFIQERKARACLVGYQLKSVGVFQIKEVHRLFGWPLVVCQQAVEDLIVAGTALAGIQVENQAGEWIGYSAWIRSM